MRYIILLLLSITLFTSCQDDDDPTGIRIRVENRTDTDLQEVQILPDYNNDLSYGTVASGATTDYRTTPSADGCSFGYSTVTSGNDTIARLPPLCFVAAPLADGDYRLVLDSIVAFEQRFYFAVTRFERE